MLNQAGFKINAFPDGTNVFTMQLPEGISDQKLQATLSKDHGINIGRKQKDGLLRIKINETLLYCDNNKIAQSFKDALKTASA